MKVDYVAEDRKDVISTIDYKPHSKFETLAHLKRTLCRELNNLNELQVVFKEIEALNFNPSCADVDYTSSGKCYLVYKTPRSERVIQKLGPFDFENDTFTLVKHDTPRTIYGLEELENFNDKLQFEGQRTEKPLIYYITNLLADKGTMKKQDLLIQLQDLLGREIHKDAFKTALHRGKDGGLLSNPSIGFYLLANELE
jgi:hypothetical protein